MFSPVKKTTHSRTLMHPTGMLVRPSANALSDSAGGLRKAIKAYSQPFNRNFQSPASGIVINSASSVCRLSIVCSRTNIGSDKKGLYQ